ncbi:molybdenum ABC transporter ATP-binding protein [Alloalcanivorax xenomutans]|uniref:molybdenum ABC transporter ATP-binding protein n=1 Tax=Alloalcanivorax xenomutans TaxID=1094342 RepID=UPI0017C968D6|nr:molybdenum ABC transporter ATP-binding protein [Alloalcanivorax xenomutans]MBA4721088.1 molybdenum ABC transporter ATP-binding protein [Alcanivorax sp.]WOD26578.1 molybdenum ABC transporter ATP-binding protein [Alloalcanivorax xenomutans]
MSLSLDIVLRRGAFELSVQGTLPERGVTILFGESGAGKSSLLRAVAGLEPCQGRIEFDGERWQGRAGMLPAHRRPVGLMLQKPTLFPHLDVIGNLRYAARRAPGSAQRWEEVLELLSLTPLLSRRVRGLSGGEASRVALGRALLSAPRLLLLDEPLAALDQARRQALMEVIGRVAKTIPVLYVSHHLDEVLTLGEHLWWLRDGALAAQGEVNDVLAGPGSPLAAHRDAAVVLRTRHLRYEQDHHLLVLALGACEVRVPASGPGGDTPRLRVAARDVSLTLSPATDSSVLNILPAVVDDVRSLPQGQCLVRLRCEQQWLLARLSSYSRDRLGLAPGIRVHAQIKAAALV